MVHLLLFAYIVGAVPTGYWISQYFFSVDITRHGSGNIGASNVARVLGKRYFFIIFFIDACKAYAVLHLYHYYCIGITDTFLYMIAAVVLMGNAYSCFLHFKGGKGVATIAGIYSYFLSAPSLMLFVFSWLLMIWLTQKPFVASLTAVALITCINSVGLYDQKTLFFIFLFVWVIFRHYSNIFGWLKIVRWAPLFFGRFNM